MAQAGLVGWGLAGAGIWGAADFCGGLATRRTHVLSAALVAQATGLVALLGAAVALGERPVVDARLAWGIAAGVVGAVGLLLFYRALALGPMSLVAPLSAVVAATVPVPFAVAMQGAANAFQGVGIAIGILGIWLVAGGPRQAQAITRPAVLLALGAGSCFGVFFVLLHLASPEAAMWPLVVGRVAGLLLVGAAALSRGIGVPAGRSAWGPAVLAGILDAGGNASFVMAAEAGRLDVASLLVSLYPAGTVLLALLLLRERLTARQGVGIAALIGGVVLLALG